DISATAALSCAIAEVVILRAATRADADQVLRNAAPTRRNAAASRGPRSAVTRIALANPAYASSTRVCKRTCTSTFGRRCPSNGRVRPGASWTVVSWPSASASTLYRDPGHTTIAVQGSATYGRPAWQATT